MNCKEFFDARAADWDANVNHDSRKIDRMLDMLGISRGQRILDVGCGTGVLFPFLEQRVGAEGHITGVDLSVEMIKVAGKKYGFRNLSLIVGDIQEISLGERFDIATCYSVFPHFVDRERALLNIWDLLVKDGLVSIMHSESRSEINKFHNSIGRDLKSLPLPPAPELEKLLERCGFKPLFSVDNESLYIVTGQKL